LPFGLELNVVRAKITSFAQGGSAGSSKRPKVLAWVVAAGHLPSFP